MRDTKTFKYKKEVFYFLKTGGEVKMAKNDDYIYEDVEESEIDYVDESILKDAFDTIKAEMRILQGIACIYGIAITVILLILFS